jgi:hypothetical protein
VGTNFYIVGIKKDDSGRYSADYPRDLHREPERVHLGKRSAAGLYCWDCGVTLCKDGKSRIHFTKLGDYEERWHQSCPQCGKMSQDEKLEESTVGRELGFNKSEPRKKKGVTSCSSFNWAIKKSHWKKLAEIPNTEIKNEYGDVFTIEQFEAVLSECPVQYFHLIGSIFS